MMPELKLTETNQELRKELDAALLKIKSYEAIISDMQTENSNLIRKTTHDLSNPLQILAMTIESLEVKAPVEMMPTLERMKRSTDLMISIITNLRKLASVNNHHKLAKDI